MTMHKALHPRYNVDKLYVSRKEGGRGLASIEDSVDASIQGLEDYIETRRRLVSATRNDTDNTKSNRTTITRRQKWEEKLLYGRFKRLINISHEKTWTWLRKGRVISKTQNMVLDASLLNTQHYKVWIKDKVEQSWEWSSAFPYTSV